MFKFKKVCVFAVVFCLIGIYGCLPKLFCSAEQEYQVAIDESTYQSNMMGIDNVSDYLINNGLLNSVAEYGGVYADEDGNLNILTTKEAMSCLKKDIVKIGSQQYFYDDCKFSLSDLREVKTFLESYMVEYGIFKLSLLQKENCVEVFILEEFSSKIERLLIDNNFNPNIIKINICTQDQFFVENRQIYPGSTVVVNAGLGTLCTNGYDYTSSKKGAITCSHVVSKGENLYDEFRKLIGVCTKSKKEKTVDASFTPFTNDWESTSTVSFGVDTYDDVRLGSDIMIVEGQKVKKYGATTGITTGEITSTDISIRTQPSNVLLSHIFEYNNESMPGDSGGPVYYQTGNTLYLLGMHYAGNSERSRGFACRMSEVINKLHIVPLTQEPIPIELIAGGTASAGCNGNAWNIILKNHNEFEVNVVYNAYMCHEDDAKFFRNLNNGHQRIVTIPAKSQKEVSIRENGTAGFITAGIVYERGNNEKHMLISYANEISSNSLSQWVNPIVLSVGQIDEEPEYLNLKVKKMYQTLFWRDWDVVIENKNDFTVKVEYNQRMCFKDDAANFTNLTERTSLTISPNSSIVVRINSNGTADYITASIDYTLFGTDYKKVTYADKLSNNPYSLSKHYKLIKM